MLLNLYMLEVGVRVYDLLEQFHSVVALKWRESRQHFMNKAAQAPPVDLNPMPLFSYDLGGQVFGSAAHSLRLLLVAFQYFGESEVRELDVARFVYDDVLGLEAGLRLSYSRYTILCLCS